MQRPAVRRLVLLLPLVVLLAAVSVHQVDRGGLYPADTVELLDGVAAVDACLEEGKLRCEGVDKWPLLQYAPALAFKRLGLSREDTAAGLVALNGLAVLLLFGLAWVAAAPGGAAMSAFALLGLLASPLLWYAGAGFGEPLAALLTAGLVVALVRGWHPGVVVACVFGAGISKETAVPFLLALGLIAVKLQRAPDPRRRQANLIALLSGGVLAVAANLAFNVFRFGTVENVEYARPGWVVPGVARKAEFFAAELVSPNAGVLWFWPLAAAAFVAALVLAFRHRRRGATAPVAVAVVLLATLASWWSPFGWNAYASRLLVPWVPAFFLLTLLGWPQLGAGLRRLIAHRAGAVACCLVVVVAAMPQLGVFLARERPLELFNPRTLSCRALPVDVYERVRAGDEDVRRLHSSCTSDRAWSAWPVHRDGFSAFGGSNLVYLVVLAGGVTGLVAFARRPLRGPGSLS